jgi:hypothetical protein
MESELDPLEGRITVGKSKAGDIEDVITLRIKGKTLFLIQKLIETGATHAVNYLDTRTFVLLAEELRQSIAEAQKRGRRAALVGRTAGRLPENAGG